LEAGYNLLTIFSLTKSGSSDGGFV